MEIWLSQVCLHLLNFDLFGVLLNHKKLSVASNTVKDVFVCLVNFLAYFEAEEATKEEAEAEIQKLKQQTVQYEKRLLEDEKYLSKCQQVFKQEP